MGLKNNYPNLMVTPDKKIHDGKIPQFLSKYYSLNERNIDAFLNQEIYVSQPDQFNDLFDLNYLLLNFDNITLEQIFEYGSHLNDKKKERLELDFNSNRVKVIQQIKDTVYQDLLQNFGIFCLTSEIDNELMWAHYTNNSGFAIEFDWSRFNDYLGPFPINYFDKNKLDFSKVNLSLGLFVEALTKKTNWHYENEYRMFFKHKEYERFRVSGLFTQENNELIINGKKIKLIERKRKYDNNCIKRIVLGFSFFGKIEDLNKNKRKINENEFIIKCNDKFSMLRFKLLDKAKRDNIKVELLHLYPDAYKLQPVEIEYEFSRYREIKVKRVI